MIQHYGKHMSHGNVRNPQPCWRRRCSIPETQLRSNWIQRIVSKLVNCNLLRLWGSHPQTCFQLHCTVGSQRQLVMTPVRGCEAKHMCHVVNQWEFLPVAPQNSFCFVAFGQELNARDSSHKLWRVLLQLNMFVKLHWRKNTCGSYHWYTD